MYLCPWIDRIHIALQYEFRYMSAVVIDDESRLAKAVDDKFRTTIVHVVPAIGLVICHEVQLTSIDV